jgi:hypothetical protein
VTSEDLKVIQQLLERIQTLKQHRRVQPLKERKHYGFEYSRAEDPSRMVPVLELTEEEVLERLKKVLKGVTIVPHIVLEYHADHLPPAISCFCFCFASTFFRCFFLLCEYFYLCFFCLSCCCWSFAGLGVEFRQSDPF